MSETATNVDHDHLPTRHTIATATDANLARIAEAFEDHAWDCGHPSCHRVLAWCEDEQDARDLATSDDPRVRESVGVFDA